MTKKVRLSAKVDNWVYVTGAPRSGTTFAGLILSTPLSVDYIHEPFNPDCGLPGVSTEYAYTRRGAPNEPRVRAMVEAIQRYRFTLRTGYYPSDTRLRRLVKRIVGSRGPFHLRLAKANVFRRAAVVKDPTGCLLTKYLADEFGFRPLVIVRHPAAFVASLMRIGADLASALAALAENESLMADYFDGESDLLPSGNTDDVIMGATLWRAVNKALLCQAASVSTAVVVRHEDLSAQPVGHFRRMYEHFDLPWSGSVERKIRRLTSADNKAEASRGKVQDFRRDSARLLEIRLRMLTRSQRETIHRLTADVTKGLYPEESFLL